MHVYFDVLQREVYVTFNVEVSLYLFVPSNLQSFFYFCIVFSICICCCDLMNLMYLYIRITILESGDLDQVFFFYKKPTVLVDVALIL